MRTVESHADTLARYLPTGKLWRAKFIAGTVMRRLLTGIAYSMQTIESTLEFFVDQLIPISTSTYIAEWERALAIPDTCFPFNTADLSRATRLRNISIKLAALGVQTDADFEHIGTLFGIPCTVNSGIEHDDYATALPALVLGTAKAQRNTIVVVINIPSVLEFPYDYPIPFGDSDLASLRCLFTHLKPAHCNIVFVTA